MKRLSTILISVLLLTGLGVSTATQAGDQVLLGERHVTDRSEKDTINVGKKRGALTGLRVKVKGSAVEFKRVVVHFENGSKQVIEKNRVIGKGDKSRVIDLDGESRFVDKVVFTYEARSRGWKGAQMKLFGIR